MSAKLAVQPIQVIGSIDPVNSAGTGAIAVEAKGSDPGHDQRVTHEVGTA